MNLDSLMPLLSGAALLALAALGVGYGLWKSRRSALAALAAAEAGRQQAEQALAEYRNRLEEMVEARTLQLSAANAELVRAARLKDEFMAGMSHELRTPLNTILGMAEILREGVYGSLTEQQAESVALMETSGRHLLALINDILDLSKIGAGKLELDMAPVSAEAVCQASLQLIHPAAENKRLKVISNLDRPLPTLQADYRRLKQILVNLLSNAVKFTPEGGTIGLEVTMDAEKQAAYFAVWDTGIGIAPQDMDRLFKPFVQLDGSLARQQAGTGLGLSLAYRLAEMHGGSIAVESALGQGSRFTVWLPWREPGQPDSSAPPDIGQAAPASPAPLATRTQAPTPRQAVILVAEDNPDTASILFDYLQVKGYRVLVARDGREALDQASQIRPDLILMDVQMPKMDGLEAIGRIRATPELAAIPIIAMTALAMPGDQERCLAAGADAYLSKPVSPKSVIEAIAAYAQRWEVKRDA